jgi:hypothetical protein
MDQRLNAFKLHNLLHGYRGRCSTGAAKIETKLAQQLAHLEQVRIFLDLVPGCLAFSSFAAVAKKKRKNLNVFE